MWKALNTSAVNLHGTVTVPETFKEEYSWQLGTGDLWQPSSYVETQRPQHRDIDPVVTDVCLRGTIICSRNVDHEER